MAGTDDDGGSGPDERAVGPDADRSDGGGAGDPDGEDGPPGPDEGDGPPGPDGDDGPLGTEGDDGVRSELDRLWEELESLEDDVDDRTVPREEFEAELRAYVRRRIRRGHATGWGPYLVLLYGTAMTIGAFVELSGLWAILAMVVIWLSTLGLYVFMIVVGLGLGALSTLWRARDLAGSLLSRR